MCIRQLLLCWLGALAVSVASSAAQAQSLDYGATESLFGQPVTTLATGTPQRAQDVAVNMTIITADEIRQSGARNVAAVLARVPGLNILRTSSTVYDVGARGFQQSFQPRLLVLVDGRSWVLDGFTRVSWDNLPVNIDDVRQIEVVLGASSALFGSNAVAAVINIVTYSPLYDNNNVVSGTFGSQSTREGDATFTTKLGDWGGLKLTAGGLIGEEFHVPRPANEQLVSLNPYKGYAVADSVLQLAPNLQALLTGSYSRDRADTGNIQTVVSTNYTTTIGLRAQLQWDSDLGAIKFDNYINRLRLEPHPPGGGTCNCFNNDLYVTHLEDQFRPNADNTFRLAVEYRQKDEETHTVPVKLPGFAQSPSIAQHIATADGTWLWQISDKLSLTNAARLDHQWLAQTGQLSSQSFVKASDYDQSLNTFSANSGLVYQANEVDTYRLTYGRGVQVPGTLEYGFNTTVFNPKHQILDIEGNPRLKPTVVTNYEFDYGRALPEILSTLKFSAFYDTNDNVKAPFHVIGPRVTPNGTHVILEQDINVGNSNGWGSEIELKGSSPAGWRWDGSYSYARAVDSPGVTNSGGFDDSTPIHHFRALLGYTTGPWEFDGDAQYVTSSILARTNLRTSSPAYSSLTGRIAYTISDWATIALEGTNLTQAVTQESPFPNIDRQILVTLTGRF